MEKLLKIFLSFNLSILLMSCAGSPTINSSKEVVPEFAGSVILFNEKSATEPEHISRYIITQNFMRIDYGKDTDDFVLFDRRNNIIYNVVHGDSTIMKIQNKDTSLNKEITWEHRSEQSHALMRSSTGSDTLATHHTLSLAGQTCYDVVIVDNLLLDESKALNEYQSVLSGELIKSYQPDEQNKCFDAINILDPSKRYSFGFPYREWSSYGYQRFMANYRQKIIFPETLFKLPESYRTY